MEVEGRKAVSEETPTAGNPSKFKAFISEEEDGICIQTLNRNFRDMEIFKGRKALSVETPSAATAATHGRQVLSEETPSAATAATHGNPSKFKAVISEEEGEGEGEAWVEEQLAISRARTAAGEGRKAVSEETPTAGNPSKFKAFISEEEGEEEEEAWLEELARSRARTAAGEDKEEATTEYYAFNENPYLQEYAAAALAAGAKVHWTPSSLMVSEPRPLSGDVIRSAPKWFLRRQANKPDPMK